MLKKKKAKTRSEAGPRKAAKKKAAKKARVKSAPKKKAVGKPAKKAAGKRTAKKAVAKRTSMPKQRAKKGIEKLVLPVVPGPPSGSIPPVEEPMRQEEAIGIVTHYYSHLGVGVVQVNKGSLRTSDMIHIKGHSTDFMQKVESMEYEHRHTDQAGAGQSVGLKVVDHVREHDIVYLVK